MRYSIFVHFLLSLSTLAHSSPPTSSPLSSPSLSYELITKQQHAHHIWNVSCLTNYSQICPLSTRSSLESTSVACARIILDDIFTDKDIQNLYEIVQKGMRNKTLGGPTILDINTGFIRDSNGVENLFTHENVIFSSSDFETYGQIIHRLKSVVSSSFGFEVHFTTPTFITRLDGSTPWQPSGSISLIDTSCISLTSLLLPPPISDLPHLPTHLTYTSLPLPPLIRDS